MTAGNGEWYWTRKGYKRKPRKARKPRAPRNTEPAAESDPDDAARMRRIMARIRETREQPQDEGRAVSAPTPAPAGGKPAKRLPRATWLGKYDPLH